jgi:hypothetical protein
MQDQVGNNNSVIISGCLLASERNKKNQKNGKIAIGEYPKVC